MATHLQKYNGKNTHNNQVEVDFEKREVNFKPILKDEEKEEEARERRQFVGSLQCIIRKIFIPIIIFLIVIDYTAIRMGNPIQPVFIKVMFLGGIMYFACEITRLLFISKKFKYEIMPKLNAVLIHIRARLNNETGLIEGTIDKESIKNREFKIRDFQNIVLKYQAKGDMAKQLRKIEIRPIFKDNPYIWEATFKFKKEVKDGTLHVKYI